MIARLPRLAVLGAVKIDDVQPVGAQVAVFGQQRHGVGGIARLAGEIAVQQAHAASGFQIDGGNETHGSAAARSLS